jgi:hypothetical protein
MKNKVITLVITILSLHLWYTNADLLITAKSIAEDRAPLSAFTLTVLSLFALSYSVLSAIAVVKIRHYIYVAIFAILDGFAIYLRINVDQNNFLFITSVFYAVYTAYIITVCWLLNRQVVATIPEPKQPKTAKKPTQASTPELPLNIESIEPTLLPYKTAVAKINGSHRNPEIISMILERVSDEDKQKIQQMYNL